MVKSLTLYNSKELFIMNTVEKRDYIHSHLHFADESTIDEFYNKLKKWDVMKEKLVSRALKSEEDIKGGRVYNRSEVEDRLGNIGK